MIQSYVTRYHAVVDDQRHLAALDPVDVTEPSEAFGRAAFPPVLDRADNRIVKQIQNNGAARLRGSEQPQIHIHEAATENSRSHRLVDRPAGMNSRAKQPILHPGERLRTRATYGDSKQDQGHAELPEESSNLNQQFLHILALMIRIKAHRPTVKSRRL
jgi:hypothetical protein